METRSTSPVMLSANLGALTLYQLLPLLICYLIELYCVELALPVLPVLHEPQLAGDRQPLGQLFAINPWIGPENKAKEGRCANTLGKD